MAEATERDITGGPAVADSVLDLVGRTPMVRLRRMGPSGGARVWAKLESWNPAGSVKDRIALGMIEAAEAAGRLRPGATIVEATSGNTGIGLAMVAAVKGYRLILTMPESLQQERHFLLENFGAEVVYTPAADGMAGAVAEAERIAAGNPGSFTPSQFDNPTNPETHSRTTGREILEATRRGGLDALVAGIGTGGTITGVARALRAEGCRARIIGVEPQQSPMLTAGRPGWHMIHGIGANFIPPVLDRELLDEVRTVKDADAFRTARRLAREEGLLAGISSGAAAHAALAVAAELGPEQLVVVILPDGAERYASMEGYFSL